MSALQGKRVLLGVTGGIAAYKSAYLVRLLVQAGADVHVVMTAAAQQFIGAMTLQTLSKNEVLTDLFDLENRADVRHIALADEADVAVIAPATAEVISGLARGSGSDVLKTVFLAVRCPVVLAPAMNVSMWEHPAVSDNVAKLREWGYQLVGPESGELAEGYSALGRMSEPDAIVQALEDAIGGPGIARSGAPVTPSQSTLGGAHVLVTAGPTRERIDAVRFLTNASSGKMGYAIAAAAAARGAQVTLVSGPTTLPTPHGVDLVRVETAEEMLEACKQPFAACRVFVATAAVADFRPETAAAGKVKKDQIGETLKLVPNPDILATLASTKGSQVCVGFAAETEDVLEHARAKLGKKNLDYIVANDVSEGRGFGTDVHELIVLDTHGAETPLGPAPKAALAHALWDVLEASLGST